MSEPRISLDGKLDHLLLDKYEELLEIDLNDIRNTKVLLSWISAPCWRTAKSIRDLVKEGSLTVQLIHSIKAMFESMGQHYWCLEYA